MPTFTVAGSAIGFSGGNYKSETPMAAAKKAGRQLFLRIKNDTKYKKFKSKTSIKFVLRQKATGNPGKTHVYVVTQKKLKTPKTIKRGDVDIKIEFEYVVSPIKITDKEHKSMVGGEPQIPLETEPQIPLETDSSQTETVTVSYESPKDIDNFIEPILLEEDNNDTSQLNTNLENLEMSSDNEDFFDSEEIVPETEAEPEIEMEGGAKRKLKCNKKAPKAPVKKDVAKKAPVKKDVAKKAPIKKDVAKKGGNVVTDMMESLKIGGKKK